MLNRIRYLTPRQPSVTSFLASLAQASHSLVPPDVLEPLVQKIANEFVSEAAASEVASAGLNAIREICVRQPLAMSNTLLQDLVMYRKSKDKGVMMAAKGLLSLYREVGAELLKKKDRGKEATMGLKSGERKEKRFGEEEIGRIEGLELLESWKLEEERRKAEDGETVVEDEPEDWGAWNVEETADSDDSGGWINVESDAEIDISDSDEDEKPPSKKLKSQTEEPVEAQHAHVDDGVPKAEKEPHNLATTKILTPADLAKLRELNAQAGISKAMGSSKRKSQTSNEKSHDPEAPLTATSISNILPINRHSHKSTTTDDNDKDTKKPNRSKAGRRQAFKLAAGKSTTNREKARRKNVLMTLGKAKRKDRGSLTDKRKLLKAAAGDKKTKMKLSGGKGG